MNEGDSYEDDAEDLETRLHQAQRQTRRLQDSKAVLQFFNLLFSQPEIYSGIDTAFNRVFLPPIASSWPLKPTLALPSCSTASGLGWPLLPTLDHVEPGRCQNPSHWVMSHTRELWKGRPRAPETSQPPDAKLARLRVVSLRCFASARQARA